MDLDEPKQPKSVEMVNMDAMDSEVWEHLPEQLLRSILARLPWWSNLKMRSVCQSWNRVLRDTEFLKSSIPAPSEHPPCWISKTSDENCYGIRNWTKTKGRSVQKTSLLPGVPRAHQYAVNAAAGGLLLMENQEDRKLDRIVVNPLNGTCRRVPHLPKLEDAEMGHTMGMVVDQTTQSHKIIFVHRESIDRRGMMGLQEEIYVYDLKDDQWRLVSSLMRTNDDHRRVLYLNAVIIAGDLYILTLTQAEEIWMYRVFKVSPKGWEEVPAILAYQLKNVDLFEHNGYLMLVGSALRSLRVQIWRHDWASREWEEMLTMPEEMLGRGSIKSPESTMFKFHSQGDHLCFIDSPSRSIRITCDMVKREWWSGTSPTFRFMNGEEIGWLFQPRLDIVL
ncbi:hypothetical protein R1flu_014459 [Riccia fluitans]|uniref:F-box domain-containing protein n=1 Tax=Riccia fluitans TaxID=41844 RepID=A0ABD1YGE5_9MARC